MEKICRTCEHWQVTGSGNWGKAMFPGSWGTERRDVEATKCKCARLKRDLGKWFPEHKGPQNIFWTKGHEKCNKWKQATDIIDECVHCGALLFEYDRPMMPESEREIPKGRLVRFWHGGDDNCEHEGENYHGRNPWDCGMCQGHGNLLSYRGGPLVKCDACHGKGTVD